MATVLSMANFKGGVGKTSSTALLSWALAKKGFKVLAIDFDPQANLTELLLKTGSTEENIITVKTSLMAAIIANQPLKDIRINIAPNLDLLPDGVDFAQYPRFLDGQFEGEAEKVGFFKQLVDPLRSDYDFIFIDVPPTMSLQNDSAFFATDQIVIVLQTQERALTGAENFIAYLQKTLIDEFNASVDILGVLPVLSKRRAAVDQSILDVATKEFGEENMFKNTVMIMERIKRYDMTGITDNIHDGWDKKVHMVFSAVADEIVQRLKEAE
ncbi:ParA family protein [Lacticaseibacillus paracasei]|jgi:cellulose biosynthesis protein BcsQ|uniref:ParA family protein n=1 Tax=Lacticaseibacillus paracasei TaxID=1597 RepID=UPI000297867E|nr:AAA family ATPase [Lacticaseibacillus paracasei]EKP98603.1 chromosome/plasmid partitioning protein, sporulation initiation inhibitor [Lacticaseibacillus casei 21/1]MBS0992915.1 AAA family ATPase [Lacticaseibacillus paracasei]QPC26341.1 AAA family ATPase [Lacticaseibacillus paracasei subsp. tolerans]QPC29244.1 AAA family ATPase [Lacticaseibacillus paracasei subsp. tolerans]RNE41868.1 Sporulation initiation inhibitor protein soj [Lacticaseibacillus paracasei]